MNRFCGCGTLAPGYGACPDCGKGPKSRKRSVEKATRPQLADLVQLLVERVQAKDWSVDPASIEWTPPARPFLGEGALLWRPRTGAGRLSPYRLHERLVAYT